MRNQKKSFSSQQTRRSLPSSTPRQDNLSPAQLLSSSVCPSQPPHDNVVSDPIIFPSAMDSASCQRKVQRDASHPSIAATPCQRKDKTKQKINQPCQEKISPSPGNSPSHSKSQPLKNATTSQRPLSGSAICDGPKTLPNETTSNQKKISPNQKVCPVRLRTSCQNEFAADRQTLSSSVIAEEKLTPGHRYSPSFSDSMTGQEKTRLRPAITNKTNYKVLSLFSSTGLV